MIRGKHAAGAPACGQQINAGAQAKRISNLRQVGTAVISFATENQNPAAGTCATRYIPLLQSSRKKFESRPLHAQD